MAGIAPLCTLAWQNPPVKEDEPAVERLVTELRRHEGSAEFVVATDVVRFQDALVHMGWSPVGQGTFSRRLFTSATDVDRVYERFTQCIERMVLQSLRLVPVAWDVALAEFTDRASASRLQWWLYGSAALAVRGIDIEPRDVDIAVDDAHLAADLLSDLVVEPVSRHDDWVAEWTGRAFYGAIIEWLAGGRPTGHVPPHEQEPSVVEFLEPVSWQGRSLLVPPLEIQLAVAEARGLSRRRDLIRQAMC
jgi:hypothetical protein